MTSDGALRVYQASIRSPIGPLTQMQPRTALFVLRPNLPQWLEEADTTITRLGRRTNDGSYFDDCILKQSLCSTTVITAKAAAKLLATACCCCFQTAVALLWTYEVTSTEVPIRLLRKLRRRCMALFTTFWNPDVRRHGVISLLSKRSFLLVDHARCGPDTPCVQRWEIHLRICNVLNFELIMIKCRF